MKTESQQALIDTLDALMEFSREGVRPDDAQSRVGPLRERYPEVGLQLVWEEEAYDRAVHYDALLQIPEGGTVSLSFCPERALPWPLRGVQHWRDQELVRVNGYTLRIDQAVASLDVIWNDTRLVDRLVEVCLIEEALGEESVDLPADELQQAVDGFRRAHRLYTAADTHRWLERRGMSQRKLELLAASAARIARLRDRVAGRRVDSHFVQHHAGFDQAHIARIHFTDEAGARAACEEIRAGKSDFYGVAERRFRAAAGRGEQPPDSMFTVVRRGELPVEPAAAVFAASAGDVVGPLLTPDGWAVVRVLAVVPATLDQPTRSAIKHALFQEWLEERRQSARIEWNWGIAAPAADEATDTAA